MCGPLCTNSTLGLTDLLIVQYPRPQLYFAFISQCPFSNTMVATESRMRAWSLAVISIALCATGLATASATNVALSDEKIQMSKTGNLHYESLSDDEKLLMFKQYVTDCQRVVRDDNDKIVHVTTDLLPKCLMPYITFYIRTVHVRNRRNGKIRCIQGVHGGDRCSQCTRAHRQWQRCLWYQHLLRPLE